MRTFFNNKLRRKLCPNLNYVLIQAQFVVSPSSPHMTLEEFERNALEIFNEYFEHGDTQEVVDSLEEFNIKNFKPEVWMCAVSRAEVCCMHHIHVNMELGLEPAV